VSVCILQDNSDDIMLCSVRAVYSCVCGGLSRRDACIFGMLCNDVMYINCICQLFAFVHGWSLSMVCLCTLFVHLYPLFVLCARQMC
jgi:hypothetical protein